MSKEKYKKMLEIKRKNEIKKLPLLYVLFCLLLKIDPLPAKMDFRKARVKLTKEMKIEIKYMNELSRQAVLLTENKIDEELKILAPKIKQLNTDIQNCYKIEKRTILWQKEYDQVMKKEHEQQKQNELKQRKKKTKNYLK